MSWDKTTTLYRYYFHARGTTGQDAGGSELETFLRVVLQSLIFKKGEFRNKAPEFYEEAGGSHNIKMRNTMRQIYTNMALL